MIDNSLAELNKKIKILNSPLDTERKKEKDIAVLNITEVLDNENTDRHNRLIICHKCKKEGHTKKQCARQNKLAKQISMLKFEKDTLNKLMTIFNISQEEIDQVKKNEELKSTNPFKVNKRKRKQKDIIDKLINNLPNQDKKDYRSFHRWLSVKFL